MAAPSILRRIFSRQNSPVQMTAPRPAARFSVEVPPEIVAAITAGGTIAPRISRDQALQVPAVLRSRNLIAGTLASLPHVLHDPQRREVHNGYLLGGEIDPDIPNTVVWAQTYEDLLFEGIAWWRVTEFNSRGWPIHARYVPHGAVHVAGSPALPSQMRISPDQPFPADGQVFIDGIPIPDREIIRFDSPNPPLLRHAARAIRTCLRLDIAAALYVENPMPLGYFRNEDGADGLSDAAGSAGDGTDRSEIEATLDDWEAARAKRAWGYLQGLKAETLQWDPEQLQLADQRQHAVLEIARAAGVDPEDLGVSTTSRTYQNGEMRRRDLLDFTLGAYVSAVQDRLSMRDVAPRGYNAKIKFAGFLRSDTKTRMETYDIGLDVGAYMDEEIRELEDKPPLTREQREQVEQRRSSRRRTTRQEPQMTDGKPDLRLVSGARFEADDAAARVMFDDAEVAQTFRVNTEKRTISGLAVPWGKVARSGFSRWRFAEGSLHWSSVDRVKLNLHHDFTEIVGKAIRLQSTSRGLDATFKVGRGPEGDLALMKAEDGLLDGFSIEVDFGEDDDWQMDPTDESVRLVRSGTLRGVALTGMPAFDDARVVRVAATRDGRKGAMPEEKPNEGGQTGTVALSADTFTGFMSDLATKVADAQKTATEGLAEQLGETLTAGVKAMLENLHDPQHEGPEPVRAARFTVTREAPVYTFDGRGSSLVRDAWYAQREHDNEAQERIRRFHQQSADVQKLVASHVAFQAGQRAQFATVTTGTASDIIPPGYRPDLFVPQLNQGRPFVNALSRGTIANATPFVVPTFGSAVGMTGDHSEGLSPTEGTLGFGVKTVTPGAISGKLPLTREIVDSSNPAIDQIALAAMREDYSRQTETKVYTMLNGASGQGGVVTSGFVPSGAQVLEVTDSVSGSLGGATLLKAVRQQLALYPFRRFGAPDRALMSQEATTAFATAEDTTGRPLLPSVGAQNTSGAGNAVTQGWFVDGLAHVPAWAISGNAAGDADTFTLNSMDAWVWESPILAFRFEEKQGPELIELALFGYFATHLLRPVGLSAIRLTLTP